MLSLESTAYKVGPWLASGTWLERRGQLPQWRITYPGSGGKVFVELLSPGESSYLSPEIHRLIVLQMTDLNSCVLNQDCGKQQQKLVYKALLRSDGSLWGGKQSSGNILDISISRKEPLTSERMCDKTLLATMLPACVWGKQFLSAAAPYFGGLLTLPGATPQTSHYAWSATSSLPQLLCT